MNFEPYIQVLPNILLAFFTGLAVTPFLRKIGLKHGFSTKGRDAEDTSARGFETRLHTGVMPRLGEFAMLIPLLVFMWRDINLSTQVLGIFASLVLIASSGAFDSKYHLSEFVKLFLLAFAGFMLVFTGTVIDLNSIVNVSAFDVVINNPITNSQLSLIAAFVTVGWIAVISTALSYVGGIDGLSEGTSAIAIFILLLIGIRNGDVLTITIGSLAFGGLLGLLPYNFHPAVIYSEHLIYGFVIAILAIVSKGKITTSLLLLTIPILDFLYVTLSRIHKYLKVKGKDAFNLRLMLHYMGTGEKNHLHHRMMQIFGQDHVKISLVQYTFYGLLGIIALAVSGLYLTLAIVSSFALFVLIFILIHRVNNS